MSAADPRDQRIAELEAQLRAALERIAELERKLSQNSKNSSKPPSSDLPGKVRRDVEPSGRKPGGQPGHQGRSRELLPIEKVDRIMPIRASNCRLCSGALKEGKNGPEPLRHQQIELPAMTAQVTEYQLHSGYCRSCGVWTCASLPAGIPRSAFGSRLIALVSLLTGRYRMSKRLVRDILWDVTGVQIGVGSVSNHEQRMSVALKVPYEEVSEYVRHENVVHQDETGWREALRLSWLWVTLSKKVSCFHISKKRTAETSKAILGADFKGILVSDRFHAYSWKDPRLRQLCWSHVIRDFEELAERDSQSRRFGKALLRQSRIIFKFWRRLENGTLSRSAFAARMAGVRREIRALLHRFKRKWRGGWASKARSILRSDKSLWTFVHVEGVEPTNNPAERALRHAVLWRKSSFGTFSSAGSRFAERILTAVATLRQQGRNVLDFLHTAYRAELVGAPPPSLLPPST